MSIALNRPVEINQALGFAGALVGAASQLAVSECLQCKVVNQDHDDEQLAVPYSELYNQTTTHADWLWCTLTLERYVPCKKCSGRSTQARFPLYSLDIVFLETPSL
ncbi:hypothetical protein Q31a_17070 [Aureliella helgolandensis]|uniref:Uncharacterized protein n=1 Tax=Aureliella helgolandensis TaxID=2527968 RepID=A0A518G4E1_9BACT|nr:hypothetical protein Q31a_17070 [Aureliella helgolandensis]